LRLIQQRQQETYSFDSTFAFLPTHKPTLKNAKELPSQLTTTQQQIDKMNRREKALGHNKGLNAMGADVLNSTFVLLFGICTKLNICASNPPLRQAPNRYSKFKIHII